MDDYSYVVKRRAFLITYTHDSEKVLLDRGP